MSKYCTGARGFNGATQSCCEQHDAAYSPDSGLSRFDADTNLLLCVARNGMPWRAVAMFVLLRLFGWVRYQG